jgi:hypothetical protein
MQLPLLRQLSFAALAESPALLDATVSTQAIPETRRMPGEYANRVFRAICKRAKKL